MIQMPEIDIHLPEEYDRTLVSVEINRAIHDLLQSIDEKSKLLETRAISETGSGDQLERGLHYYRDPSDGAISLVFRIFGENHKLALEKQGGAEGAIKKVATVTGINAKTVATTLLYKVPSGKTFIPMFIVIRVTAFTAGGKATQAVASFGGNSATYDDFLNSVTYTVANQDYYQIDRPADATEVAVQAAGDEFRISIETGSDATTETWAVDVFGYLI